MSTTIPFIDQIIADPLTIVAEHATAVNRSVNGARQAVSYGGGYWKISFSLNFLNQNQADTVTAFFRKQQGKLGTFDFELPFFLASQITHTGQIFVKGANQTGTQITVDNLPVSKNRILAEETYIQFQNSKKVYALTEPLNSDTNGEGILYLNFPLMGIMPVDNEEVIYRAPVFTVALDTDSFVRSYDGNLRSSFEIELVEVWN